MPRLLSRYKQLIREGIRLKILLLSPLPPPSGGIATWTVRYEQYCREHQIPVSIVNSALVGARKEKKSLKRNLWDEVRRAAGIIGGLIRQIHKEKPDIIHLNSSCSRFGVFRDCICALIGRMHSIPVVLQCHCNIQDQVHSKLAESAFRVMASVSKRVLVLNRFSAEYARRFAGERVIIVPNFADENDIYERKGVADEIRQIVFVGHVRREKGAIEMFEAAAQFPEIQFVLAGPVQKDMEELPHGSNVELLGSQPHETILQLLREADVFLFPSHTEGFANALLEAMAAGLPIIATDVGANAEMIENEGGIIIPVKDANAIFEAIQAFKGAPDYRLGMSNWNTKKVRTAYLLSTVMGKIMDIYEEVTT